MSIVAPAFSAAAIASSSRTVAPVVRLGEVGMLLEVLLEALLVGREAEEPVVLAQPLEVGRVEINPAPGARAIDDQQGSCALDPPGRQEDACDCRVAGGLRRLGPALTPEDGRTSPVDHAPG